MDTLKATRPPSKATTIPSVSPTGFVEDVRPWLFHWQTQHIPTALVTLVNYEGSSPRPLGSQMVVNDRGEHTGLISGGCLEAALVEEAQACLRSGEHRLVRYGKDSDYFDIQLPCGSGIDVLITPHPDSSLVQALQQAYVERSVLELAIRLPDLTYQTHPKPGQGQHARRPPQSRQLSRSELSSSTLSFSKTYHPRTRIVVAGRGAIFESFLAMAQLFDVELLACSPGYNDQSEPVQSGACLMRQFPLRSPGNFNSQWLDTWSAFISLSHDHDWETEILAKVLESDVFHIAALGSRKTHARRRALLKSAGLEDAQLQRIRGPAGLHIGGSSPPEIALAILAEIVAVGNGKQFP